MIRSYTLPHVKNDMGLASDEYYFHRFDVKSKPKYNSWKE